MSTMKTVHFEGVKEMMEQMLQVPIFRLSEKRKMLRDENESVRDPHLIMDMRHRIFREPLPISPTKEAILKEAKRLLMDEETEALYGKREQAFLESELKKFQKQLRDARPKSRGSYGCSRKLLADSGNERFWSFAPCRRSAARSLAKRRKEDRCRKPAASEEGETEETIDENAYPGSIKVTIKDKLTPESKDRERLDVLRAAFATLRRHAETERRLRDIRTKIQEGAARRRLRRYFDTWRTRAESTKRLARAHKRDGDVSNERKIELFVNAIAEKQRELARARKSASRETTTTTTTTTTRSKSATETDRGSARKSPRKQAFIVEPPARNRLNAQRKIIAEQKTKLAEQNRIIEEMRSRQIESETRKASEKTINAAKEALASCGGRTRRTLIQLMREEGCRDKSLIEPPSLPDPPNFLVRMEARAAARRERVRKAEEARQRRLEEEKRREEAARKSEEEERKRLQREALREAKRLREEQELRRAREIERIARLNDIADSFYRRYLLRRYVMDPFVALIEMKHCRNKTAEDHYIRTILRKTFTAWMVETREHCRVKEELALTVYNRNLLWYSFRDWREFTRGEIQKSQVAADFYDIRLQERCVKAWQTHTLEKKMIALENERLAKDHCEKKIMVKYLDKWRRYPEVAKEMKEIERRKNKWRELVQRVVPDFDPKQRGVAIED